MAGSSDDARTESRREADIVRLESERLQSGLFRHRLVKFIMDLSGRDVSGKRRARSADE